ncbi:MAG: type II toxin-antitoxin system RelE family toxin [Aestuariivirga sp.]
MAWTIEFEPRAIKDLDDLDIVVRRRVLSFLRERVALLDDPRQLGEMLEGKKYRGIWKYRVGDYRVLAEIKDAVVTILVVEIGHRREIYR